jgi:hypothetical protein
VLLVRAISILQLKKSALKCSHNRRLKEVIWGDCIWTHTIKAEPEQIKECSLWGLGKLTVMTVYSLFWKILVYTKKTHQQKLLWK